MCRTDPFLALTVLWVAAGSSAFGFDAKRVYAGQKNNVVDFNEADAKAILLRLGITNWLPYSFERDSTGAALFVNFSEIASSREHVLIITEEGWKLIDLPRATGSSGFFDDFTEAYSFEND